MNLKNYYYFFQSAIPERICDDIVKYAKQTKDKIAKIGKYENTKKLNKKEIKDLKEVRDSNIVWLNDNWIYKEIHPLLNNANVNAGWNFDWDFSESCQFTKYKKGGEIQFDFRNTESKKIEIKTCKEILPKGSLIVFPSFVWHRVSPVTSGERNSLVLWNLGYPFK